MTTTGPYVEKPKNEWTRITEGLIKAHPLSGEFVEVVNLAWADIFATKIGAQGYTIGKDIILSPQIMGAFLHELIPLIFHDRYPDKWSRQVTKDDKDLVCLTNPALSVEIKTSSDPSKIFGNRSYAQPSISVADSRRKGKSGYYLAINFEKFEPGSQPKVVKIQFGWLDHSDWIPQKSPTGQQARVHEDAYKYKLRCLYPNGNTAASPS